MAKKRKKVQNPDSRWRTRFLASKPSTKKLGVYYPDRNILWTRQLQEAAEELAASDDEQKAKMGRAQLEAWATARELETDPVVLVPPGHATSIDRSMELSNGKITISRFRTMSVIDCCWEPATDADGELLYIDGALKPGQEMFGLEDIEDLERDDAELAGELACLSMAVTKFIGGLRPTHVVTDDVEDVEGNSEAE